MDCIANPVSYYDGLFALESDSSSASETFAQDLLTKLNDPSNKAPLINATPLDSIPDGHMVCIYGMIQDMFNTEIYVNEFKHVDTGNRHSFKYRDFISSEFNLDENTQDIKFSERQSFYVVPIPGESLWVMETRATSHGSMPFVVARGGKRLLISNHSSVCSKKLKIGDSSDKLSTAEHKYGKQFPLSEEEGDDSKTGCLVRVYDPILTDSLKLNEMVRIYGILQHARLGAGFDQDDCATDAKGQQPVPHLHAVIVERLAHNNPYFGLTFPLFSDWLSTNKAKVVSTRARIMTWLTDTFSGDRLAAEYTLLHMLSPCHGDDKQTSVSSTAFPSRSLALNLVVPVTTSVDEKGAHPEMTGQQLCARLQDLMSRIVPQLATVEVTLDSLNSGPVLTPTRDADRGVMNAGRLQLPDGIQVLVDETGMTVGRLDARGLLNLRALTMLVTEQQVPYDFQFYSLDLDTHVRALIVSTGASLIKPTLVVPWVAASETPPTTSVYSGEDLIDVRQLLTVASQQDGVYSMEDGLEEAINADFVNWRRDKETFIEATEFAQMLCLLRLFCASTGSLTSSLDDWRYVCSLEAERKNRLKQTN